METWTLFISELSFWRCELLKNDGRFSINQRVDKNFKNTYEWEEMFGLLKTTLYIPKGIKNIVTILRFKD